MLPWRFGSPRGLESLLNKWDGFAVNIPELELLRQYHKDAVSWIAHANNVLLDITEREDQETIAHELTCIQKDASSLRVKVDELPCVVIELKKARCRVKALKALCCKMSMDYIEQLLMKASIRLQIEKEKLFADVSEVKAIAVSLEERAKSVLENKEEISEFEDVVRASEEIFVILPSLDEVKDAVSMAKSWLSRSQPFLSCDCMALGSSPSLEVETLKELASESMLLKLSLREQLMIQTLLDTCTRWEQDASSVLHETEWLLNVETIDDEIMSILSKIEKKIQAINSVVDAGQGLGFNFDMVPKLQDACSTLHWCFRALSFASAIPTLEEVKTNLEIESDLHVFHLQFVYCLN